MSDPKTTDPTHQEIEALLVDYTEGTLGEADRARVDRHLETCEECRASVNDAGESLRALSGLKKQPAPQHFDREVAETIRRRSRGRFFGRRTLGDRVPLEILALVVLVIGLGLYFLLRRSDTGSLRPFERGREAPAIHEDADDVVPRPPAPSGP